MKLLTAIFFCFIFPFLVSAQDLNSSKDSVQVESPKREWQFKRNSGNSIITVTEGQTLKITYKITGSNRSRRVKGFLVEISDDSVQLVNKNDVQLNIPKNLIIRIKVIADHGLFFGALGFICGLVGAFLLALAFGIYLFGRLINKPDRNRERRYSLAGAGLIVFGFVLLNLSSPESITDPFSKDWNYTEKMPGEIDEKNNETFHP